MKSKALVTGASGFIGTALCRHLDSCQTPYKAINRRQFSKLKSILKSYKPNFIFHLAGGRQDHPKAMMQSNITTTIDLFETIRSMKDYHPRVLVIGSAAEYGLISQARPIRENDACAPLGLYGWVKLMETQVAMHYARLGEDVVVARLFNILGPGTPAGLAAGKFAQEITLLELQKKHMSLKVSDLGGARDFLDIRDIVEALRLLALKGKTGEIYNVCSQQKVLMRDLLASMITSSLKPSLRFKENQKQKPGVLYAIGSCTKLRKTISWQPKYNLKQSIKDTLEYYRNHENSSRA